MAESQARILIASAILAGRKKKEEEEEALFVFFLTTAERLITYLPCEDCVYARAVYGRENFATAAERNNAPRPFELCMDTA